ncbi:MAG: LacI family DNA-binding transcriptional regulator [Bacillota bacterium]|nr:LacI family DNA-binding transcriptional regulator [Bacillota bacterium]
MPRTTIKQVAQIAGVSPTAVSLAINGKSGISDETRKRILSVVKQMDFIPNENSRRLLSNRTGNIAVLMDQDSSLLDQFFYSELNTQLIRECEDHQYNVIYSVVSIDDNQVVNIPKVIRTRDIDGIIIIGYLDPLIIQRIQVYEYPIIILDNYLPSAHVSSVIFDYQSAARLATEYLVENGHRSIGYIGSDISSGKIQYFGQQTFKGFKEVLGKYNLSIPASWIQISATDDETAGDAMDQILKCRELPTAVLCSGDIYAIGAMRSIKAHGLTVPGDISVIGIDDILLSRYIEPSLTTIRVDRHSMASMAITAMCNRIEAKTKLDQMLCTSHQLVERDSVKSILE